MRDDLLEPATGPRPGRGPRLRLVCINDVYTLENLPRLRTLIEALRREDPADALLVTLAGDFVAPSLLSSLDRGRGMVDCMNALPVDVVTFGNHEDDIGIEALRQRVAEFRGVWLATNLRGFQPPLPERHVVEVAAPGGRRLRVGLLGVVMIDPAVYRAAPFGGAAAEAPAAAVARVAAELQGEGCACVLALTHQPLSEDRRLALQQRDPPLPLLIGGHEHQPLIEEVGGALLVKAGADAARAVVVDLAWPAAAAAGPGLDLPRARARLVEVAAFPEDPALRARVDAHLAPLRELQAATLVALPPGAVLSSVGTRWQQTSLGTLLCDRLRDALGADCCLFNGGGIRGARDYAERLTYGDLEVELPFDNEVDVVALPGQVLADAIAASRARAPVEWGAFLQVDSGVVVTAGGALLSVAGEPFDAARTYRVALIRELLLGLDGIEPLSRYGRAHPERVPPAGSGRGVRVVLVEAFAVDLWRQLGGFSALDADGDGAVTAEELSAAIERAGGAVGSRLQAQQVLEALDADHDRRISREEAESRTPRPAKPT